MLEFISPQRGEMILEFDSSHQSNPPHELNDALTSFISSVSHSTRADSGSTLSLVPVESATTLLMDKYQTDVGKI